MSSYGRIQTSRRNIRISDGISTTFALENSTYYATKIHFLLDLDCSSGSSAAVARAAPAFRQREWGSGPQTASLAASKNMFPSPAKKKGLAGEQNRTSQIIAWQQRRGTGAGTWWTQTELARRGLSTTRTRADDGWPPRCPRAPAPSPPGHHRPCRGPGLPASPVPCVRRSDSAFSESGSGRARLPTPTPRQEKKRNGVCSRLAVGVWRGCLSSPRLAGPLVSPGPGAGGRQIWWPARPRCESGPTDMHWRGRLR